MTRHWALPMAILGGVAVGVAFALGKRDERRHEARRHHKHQVQTWEGECGNVDMRPASAVPDDPSMPL